MKIDKIMKNILNIVLKRQ